MTGGKLELFTKELEKNHPWVVSPTVLKDWRFDFLFAEAFYQLVGEGLVNEGEARKRFYLDEAECMLVRKRIAVLADFYGPIWSKPSTQNPDVAETRGKK